MISVIVPVYNGESYISSFIKMILNQTFKDFELIIINDGSIDHTNYYIQKFAKDDSRIKAFSFSNHGVSWARNFGLTQISGDFFTFLDCDDYVEKDYLEMLMNHVSEGIDAVFCSVRIIDQYSNVRGIKYINDGLYSNDEILINILDFNKVNSGPYAKLFSTKLLANDIKFKDIKIYEDLLFNVDILNHKNKYNIYFTDDTYYGYVQRENIGAMQNYINNPTSDVIIAMNYVIDTIKRYEQYDYLFYRAICQVMIYAVECSLVKNKSFIKNVQRFLRQHVVDLLKNKFINRNEKILYLIYMVSFKLFEIVRK